MTGPSPLLRAPEAARGFSLMEILAAIAIMAVLAAVAFLALQRLRGTGNAAKCIANLRQIGAAIVTRAMDYDNKLPDIDWWEQHRILEILGPYLGLTGKNPDGTLSLLDDSVLHCPAAASLKMSGRNWPDVYATQQGGRLFYTDYKFNDYGVYDGDGQLVGGVKGRKLSSFPHPSWVVLAMDIDWPEVPRHHQGDHLLFLDGRVQWTREADYWTADPYGATPWYAWGTLE